MKQLKSLMLLALLVVLGLSLRGNTKAQDDSGHKVFLPIVAVCCNEEETEHHEEPIPDYSDEEFISAASTNPSAIPIVSRFQEPMVPESDNGYEYLESWQSNNGNILHPSLDYNDNVEPGKDDSDTYPVYAIGDGLVSKTGVTVGGYVFIESKLRGGEIIGFQALHLNSKFDVKQWDTVNTGKQIGTIDANLDFGAHLDWQIQISNTVAFGPGNWPSGSDDEDIDWYLDRYVHPKMFIDEYNSSQVRLYEGIYLGYKAYTKALTERDIEDDPRQRTVAYGDGVHNLPVNFNAKSLNVPIGKTVIMYENQNGNKTGRSRAFSYPVMDFEHIGYRNWGGSLGFTPRSIEVVDNCRKANSTLAVLIFGSRDCSTYTEPTLSFVDLVAWFTNGIQVSPSNVVEIWSERPATGTNLVAAAATTYYACVVQDIPDLTGFYYPNSYVPLKGNIKYAKVSKLSQKSCAIENYPTRTAGTNQGQGQPPTDTSKSIEVWDYGCLGASIRIYNADGRKCAPLYYGRNDSLPFSPHRVEVNVGNVEIKFCPDKSSACHEVSGTASLVGSSIYGKISRAEVKRSGQIDNINDYVKWCKTRTGNAVEFDELETGVEYYTDKGYTVKNLPESYVGMKFLRMPNADKHNSDPEYVTCELRDHVKVVLAVDPRGTLPDWIRNDFKSEGQEIGVTDTAMRHFDLYGCKAESGKLVLGGPDSDSGNSDANYIIIFKRMDTRDGSDRCNAKFNVKPDVPVVYPIANSSALTETPLLIWEQSDKNTGDTLFAQVQVSQNGNTVYDSGFLPEGVEQHVPVINGYGYFTARVVVKDLKGEWNVSNNIGFTIVQPDCNHANFGEVAITTSDSCRGTVHKLGNSGKVDLVSKGLHDGDAISVWVPKDSWALLLEKADGSAGENCVGWYNGEPGHKWNTTIDHWWRRGTELNYTINGKVEAIVIGNSSEHMYCQGLHPYETEPFASYTLGENPTCTNPAILAGIPEQSGYWTRTGDTFCGWAYNGWINNFGRFVRLNVQSNRVKIDYGAGLSQCGGSLDASAATLWWLMPSEPDCTQSPTPTPTGTQTPSPTPTPTFTPTPAVTGMPTGQPLPTSTATVQPDCNNLNLGEVAVTTTDSCKGDVYKLGSVGTVNLVEKGLYGKAISVYVPQKTWALLLEKADGSAGENCVGWYNNEPGHKWNTTIDHWWRRGTELNYTIDGKVEAVVMGIEPYNTNCKGLHPYDLKPFGVYNLSDNPTCVNPADLAGRPEQAAHWTKIDDIGCGWFYNGWASNFGRYVSLNVSSNRVKIDYDGGQLTCGGSLNATAVALWWLMPFEQDCNASATATPTVTPFPTVTPTRTPVPAGTQVPTPTSTPTVVPTATSTVVATNTPVVVPSPTTEAPFGIYNLGENPNCYNPANLAGLPEQSSYWTYVGNCGWAYNGWLGNNGRFVRLHITTQRVKIDHDGGQLQCGGDLDTSAVTLWWLGEQETVCPGSVNQNSVQLFLPLVVR